MGRACRGVSARAPKKKKTVRRQIRDTERLLSREDLPETVRLTKERVLKLLQQELTEKATEKRSKKVSKKYRMVKFFERRKISRRLKSKLKEYSTSTDTCERMKLLDELHRLRKELNYVVNFPQQEKYIALYPSTSNTARRANRRKEKLLKQIIRRVENGELPDAAEAEAQWSKVVCTGTLCIDSHARDSPLSVGTASSEDNNDISDAEDDGDSENMQCGSSKDVVIDRRISKEGSKAHTMQRQRLVAPIDEEPDSESEVVMQAWKQLKEDDFFVISETI